MISHSRGAMRPKFYISFALLKNRGRREDRVRAAPAVSRAICIKKCAHEHTGSAETLRPSPRNGFTACFVLAPVTGFLATVISKITSANLTPAPGRQAHTTSPYAMATLVFMTFASTATCPSFVTTAYAPLVGQDGGSRKSDLPDGGSGIFLREGLDRLLVICPSG
jgi:hypothetical protein